MFEKATKTEIGSINVKDEVISSIASISANEIEGVLSTFTTFYDPFIHFFYRQWPKDGVKVEIQENEVKVTIAIVVQYGVDIPETASSVQEHVREKIEKLTGIHNLDVNVVVQKVSSM